MTQEEPAQKSEDLAKVDGAVEFASSSEAEEEDELLVDEGWSISRGKRVKKRKSTRTNPRMTFRASWKLAIPIVAILSAAGYYTCDRRDSESGKSGMGPGTSESGNSGVGEPKVDTTPTINKEGATNADGQDDNVSPAITRPAKKTKQQDDVDGVDCSANPLQKRCRHSPPKLASVEAMPRPRMHESDAAEKCAKNLMDACVEAGEELVETKPAAGDCREAKQLFEKACEGDNAWGCLKLGVLYDSDECREKLGVSQDERQVQVSKSWGKSCMLGATWSCRNMGSIHRGFWIGLPENTEKAKKWYARGCYPERHTFSEDADEENEPEPEPEACKGLGELMVHLARKDTSRTRENLSEAIDAFETGCIIDSGDSCFELASLYLDHDDVVRNPHYGLRLMESACEYSWSEYKCGAFVRALLDGRWLSPDPERAHALLEKGCMDSGSSEACLLGARLLEHESGQKTASAYYKQARNALGRSCPRSSAEDDDCSSLGELWMLGKGGPRSVAKALEHWLTGCEAGDSAACMSYVRVANSGAEISVPDETIDGALETYADYECLGESSFWCASAIETLLGQKSKPSVDDLLSKLAKAIEPKTLEQYPWMQIKTIDTLRIVEGRTSFEWNEDDVTKHFCGRGIKLCESNSGGCVEWLARSEELCGTPDSLRVRVTNRMRIHKGQFCDKKDILCITAIEVIRRGLVDSKSLRKDGRFDLLSCHAGYGCSFDGLKTFQQGSAKVKGISMDELLADALRRCQQYSHCKNLKVLLKVGLSSPDGERAVQSYGAWERARLKDRCGTYDMSACIEFLEDHSVSTKMGELIALVAKADCDNEAQSASARGRGCLALAELWRRDEGENAEDMARSYYNRAENHLRLACDEVMSSSLADDECVNLVELHLEGKVETSDKDSWLTKLEDHCRTTGRGCDELIEWERRLRG